jgi:hypothetical protein
MLAGVYCRALAYFIERTSSALRVALMALSDISLLCALVLLELN